MRIAHQLRAVLCQLRPEIGALPSCEPQLVGLQLRVWTPNHLEFQVGDDVVERKRRVLQKIPCANQPCLFAAPERHHDSSFRLRLFRQHARQLHHRGCAGCIVIGAVICFAVLYAKMVEVRAQQDDLIFFAGPSIFASTFHVCRCLPGLISTFSVTVAPSGSVHSWSKVSCFAITSIARGFGFVVANDLRNARGLLGEHVEHALSVCRRSDDHHCGRRFGTAQESCVRLPCWCLALA